MMAHVMGSFQSQSFLERAAVAGERNFRLARATQRRRTAQGNYYLHPGGLLKSRRLTNVVDSMTCIKVVLTLNFLG